jgi:FkbM family methyltransferase
MRKRIYQYLQSKAFNFIQLKSKLSTGIPIEIRNKMEWIIYNDIFVEGDYDLPIQNTFETPGSAINIVDLGANVGFFDLRIAHLASLHKIEKKITVKAIEASRRLCSELGRRSRSLNVNPNIQIDIVHGLVGARSGTGLLYEFNDHGLNSTLRHTGNPVETPYVDLSGLCSSFPEIHLLKCDIEGSELSFIQTYPDLLKKTRAVVIEFHTEFCNPQQCIQQLRENGFREAQGIKDYGNCFIQYFQKARHK